ncbi:MAG: hypothetical protein L6V84_04335 [Oscillospiraceae bacterium]|nr:MAG: hypothetical protein L6V84_04335 [Oscillospiraceae bacterium]
MALVRRVDSGTELDAVMSGDIKPAAVILRINSKLNITDTDGREFLSLPVALDSLAWSVMPVFEPADAATVEPLVSYLKEIRFTDCFFLSKRCGTGQGGARGSARRPRHHRLHRGLQGQDRADAGGMHRTAQVHEAEQRHGRASAAVCRPAGNRAVPV